MLSHASIYKSVSAPWNTFDMSHVTCTAGMNEILPKDLQSAGVLIMVVKGDFIQNSPIGVQLD